MCATRATKAADWNAWRFLRSEWSPAWPVCVRPVSLFGNLKPRRVADFCLRNVWAVPLSSQAERILTPRFERMFVDLTLGIDLACRAAHQASLARSDGTFVWTGGKFFTRPTETRSVSPSSRSSAAQSFSGLVPKVAQSGQAHHQHGLTKAGDPLLREALFAAADQARKTDPQLAAKYKRLMSTERHHDSAICHIATALLTRIATCWRTGEHYVLRDTDGRVISPEEGRQIVRERHKVDKQTRINAANARQSQRRKGRTGRERKESQSAPASRPANTSIGVAQVA